MQNLKSCNDTEDGRIIVVKGSIKGRVKSALNYNVTAVAAIHCRGCPGLLHSLPIIVTTHSRLLYQFIE